MKKFSLIVSLLMCSCAAETTPTPKAATITPSNYHAYYCAVSNGESLSGCVRLMKDVCAAHKEIPYAVDIGTINRWWDSAPHSETYGLRYHCIPIEYDIEWKAMDMQDSRPYDPKTYP